MPLRPTFDCAYIDGSHIAQCVLEDSVGVWPLVKPGGTVIWDDYSWRGHKELVPARIVIDTFLEIYSLEWEDRETINDQVKVVKTH